MDYHITQIIVGHGCFETYLCKIGKVSSANCRHCNNAIDSPDHTLRDCEAWSGEREELRAAFGEDLELSTLIRAAVGDLDKWGVFRQFYSRVMRAKEAREKERG